MSKRNILYILGWLLLMNSCTTHKALVTLNPTNVSVFSAESFNGNYDNKSEADTLFDSRSLWSNLYDVYTSRYYKTSDSDSSIVNLEFRNNRLIVRLLEDGNVAKEIILKAKIKDNYVSVKRKYFLLPILPIIWGFVNNKVILGNMNNGNLLLKARYSNGGCFIFMAGGTSDTVSKEYEKTDSLIE